MRALARHAMTSVKESGRCVGWHHRTNAPSKHVAHTLDMETTVVVIYMIR